jgi:hypothetical protein
MSRLALAGLAWILPNPMHPIAVPRSGIAQ